MDNLKIFIQTKVIPKAMKNDRDSNFDMETYQEMFQLGLFSVGISKNFGGNEKSVAEMIQIARLLSSGSPAINITFVANVLGQSPVALYGSEALQRKVFSSTVKNLELWSFGMTERPVGSDIKKLQCRADETADGYVISGEKCYITNASYARHFSVFAVLYDQNGQSKGVSCFYVPGHSSGIAIKETFTKIGMRESNTARIEFKNVHIPKENLLGRPGEGFKILSHVIARSKTLLAAGAVGLMDRSIELLCTKYSKTYRNDTTLIDKPLLQHEIVRLVTKKEAAWQLTKYAAEQWDQVGLASSMQTSMAKVFASNTGVEVSSRVAELFGAEGFLMDSEVAKLYRDAKAYEILEGSGPIQELIIIRQLFNDFKAQQKVDAPIEQKKAS